MYLTSIIGGALLFGTLVNEAIPREWITGYISHDLHSTMHDHAARWYEWISSAILAGLIINGYLLKFLSRWKETNTDHDKIRIMNSNIHTFRVKGMTCNHCKASVENGLRSQPSVSDVLADPARNMVTVRAEHLKETDVKRIIENLGYQYQGRLEEQ